MPLLAKSGRPGFGRKTILALAMSCALCLPPSGPPPSAKSFEDFDEPYELVLQVVRNDEALSNTLLGLQKGFTGYYLPVKGMAEILGLKADLDLENRKVTGWYIDPANAYEIDANAGTYTIRGELVDLAPEDIIVKDYGAGFGDIYVPFETLATIWPLDMTLDFSKLRLDIATKDRLPYELRRDRQNKYERFLEARDKKNKTNGYRTIENPYRLWSPPVLDLNTTTSWNGAESTWQNSTNLSGKNDLLGFSADYFTGFDYTDGALDPPDNLRLTLTRRTFGDDTMPLGLREVKLGDIGVRTPSLLVGTNGGRGVAVSSRPLRREQSFDEITVEGTATPGWEIELYRNFELIDFGKIPESGQYRFDDVELLSGTNQIKVILYGPGGEVEERVKDYQIGGGILPPGEVEYEAAIVDNSNDLISFENNTPNGGTARRDEGTAYNGEARIGVNRWLSLFGTFTNAVTRKGEQKYATAGAELSVGPVQSNIEAYKELNGGYAVDTRAATRLFGWRVNLKTQYMKNFESDRVGFDDSAKTFDGSLNVSNRYETGIGRVGITASADHEKYIDQRTQTRYQLNNTLSLQKQSYGNRILATYNDKKLSTMDGLLNSSFRLGRKTNARAYLDYQIKPTLDWRNFAANLDYRHSAKLSGGLDFNRNLISKANGIGATLTYDFDKFIGTLGSHWQQDGGVNVSMRASTSLGPYGKDGGYIMSSRSLLGQNALNTRTYLDKNLNDIYDFGDEPVENAVMMLGYRESSPTDEKGDTGFIQSIYGEYADLGYKEDSTENPFQTASHTGYSVLLRPGVEKKVDFPLVETGMIDGTASFENGKPIPGLRLQLIDHRGAVAKETLTSYDGYYTFDFVKPGSYVIRPDPALEVTMPVRTVSITPDTLFISGIDVKLLENAGLPASQIAVDQRTAEQNVVPIIDSLTRLQSALHSAVSGS